MSPAEATPGIDDEDVSGVELSAFEQGKAAGESGSSLNPFSIDSADHHHFETGRKFGSRAGRGTSSSHWRQRKT